MLAPNATTRPLLQEGFFSFLIKQKLISLSMGLSHCTCSYHLSAGNSSLKVHWDYIPDDNQEA